MPFMQRQITSKQNWLKVETTQGTTFLPGDLCLFVRNSEQKSQPLYRMERI